MSCNNHNPINAFIAGGGGGGGSVNTGVLQTLGGGALSGTLQTITDQSSNQSLLQLSTTKILMGTSSGSYPQTINIGETNRLGSALYSATYVTYADWMELRGNTGIQIPTNNLVVGTTLASARLHVRGDGTNPIGWFENNLGNPAIIIYNDRTLAISSAGMFAYNGAEFKITPFVTNPIAFNLFGVGTYNYSSGTNTGKFISSTYTINTTGGTNTITGFFLNATETSLTGTTHNLMDLQVGGVSRFKVNNSGFLTTSSAIIVNGYISLPSSASISFSGQSQIFNSSDGVIRLADNAGTSFNRLQFGGTTNAFPAIKRNGAELEAVFANDSGFCNFQAAVGRFTGFNTSAFTNNFALGSNANIKQKLVIEDGSPTAITASALVELKSTTLGFLLPKMTTTDRGNIVSPATGLKLYNTSTNNTDTFDGTNWQSFGKETKITGSLEVNIASGKVINAIEVSSAMGLGFYNAAAIIQPVTGGASATYANVSGTEIKENDTFDGYTIGNVVKALRDLGLLA
jgi:hypothetical protein